MFFLIQFDEYFNSNDSAQQDSTLLHKHKEKQTYSANV